MMQVKATREGLTGAVTASGYHIDLVVPFVALPSTKALGRFVRLTNPANNKTALAVVIDVGPWNEHDDAYVFQPSTTEPHRDGVVYTPTRPLAESGLDTRGRTTNGAGIDLGERIWHALDMRDNTHVLWEFIS